MTKPNERRRAIGQHHVLHETDEITIVLPEAFDVTLTRVGELALRTALPPPIHCCDRKAATTQISDDLKVFLNELIAPAE